MLMDISQVRNVAKAINSKLRSYDVLARYGGDEFIAILTGFQDDAIEPIAQRVLGAVENCNLTSTDQDIETARVGVSIGIAIVEAGTELDDKCLIQCADQALYTAKQDGRGKIHITVCSEESAD